MYFAVRRGPDGSSKAAGAVTALAITAVAAWAMMSGLAQDIVAKLTTETTMTVVPPQTQKPPEQTTQTLDTSVDLPKPPAPLIPTPIDFVADPLAGTIMIGLAASPGPAAGGTGAAGTDGGSGLAKLMPKLISADQPIYPATEIRSRAEGVTGLEVCVALNGRTTSAKVVASSGFPRLDDAALTWVKRARFKPGTVGGKPEVMCGHRIDYEFKLQPAASMR